MTVTLEQRLDRQIEKIIESTLTRLPVRDDDRRAVILLQKGLATLFDGMREDCKRAADAERLRPTRLSPARRAERAAADAIREKEFLEMIARLEQRAQARLAFLEAGDEGTGRA